MNLIPFFSPRKRGSSLDENAIIQDLRRELLVAKTQLTELSRRNAYLEAKDSCSGAEIGGDVLEIEGKKSIYRPVFSFDGLYTDPKVIHNHDFMKDQRYLEAFLAGKDA